MPAARFLDVLYPSMLRGGRQKGLAPDTVVAKYFQLTQSSHRMKGTKGISKFEKRFAERSRISSRGERTFREKRAFFTISRVETFLGETIGRAFHRYTPYNRGHSRLHRALHLFVANFGYRNIPSRCIPYLVNVPSIRGDLLQIFRPNIPISPVMRPRTT